MSNSKLFAVDVVRTQPALAFGKPSPLPIQDIHQATTAAVRNYDIMPDGRFLVLAGSPTQTNARTNLQINVVTNWFTELQQRVPVK